MTQLFLFFTMTLFGIFFVHIDYPWLVLLPACICGIFLINGIGTITPSHTLKQVIENNSLYISRRTMLAGITGLSVFLGVDWLYTSIYIIALNTFLRLGSYIFGYRDGKSLFQHSARIAYLGFLTIMMTLTDTYGLVRTVGNSLPYIRGMYMIVSFIIGYRRRVQQRVKSLTYALSIVTLTRTIGQIIPTISLIHLVLMQLGLCLLYLATSNFMNHSYEQIKPQVPPLDAKAILHGQTVKGHQRIRERLRKKYSSHPRGQAIQRFLENLDPRITLLINSYNSIAMIIIIIYYVSTFQASELSRSTHVLYWCSILLFFTSFVIIQKNSRLPSRQRVFVFIVSNFALYSTVLYIAQNDPISIATAGVIWNVCNSLFILYSEYVIHPDILQKQDYRYRIIVTSIGIPLNIYFLANISIPGNLLFALISTYIGLQGFLLYYNIQYIKKIPTHEQTL